MTTATFSGPQLPALARAARMTPSRPSPGALRARLGSVPPAFRALREAWMEAFEQLEAARRRWPFLEWGH